MDTKKPELPKKPPPVPKKPPHIVERIKSEQNMVRSRKNIFEEKIKAQTRSAQNSPVRNQTRESTKLKFPDEAFTSKNTVSVLFFMKVEVISRCTHFQ